VEKVGRPLIEFITHRSVKKLIPLLICLCGLTRVEGKPNIVLVLADDMTWSDCEPYGSNNVPTPNIRKLAEQGMRFDNMFTSTAMCSPARQMLFTGLFPVRSGAFPNHSRVRPGVQSIVQHLTLLGYAVSLEGKRHFGPKESFPFERRNLKRVLEREERPFCHIIASEEPHMPWTTGDVSAFDPEKITVPPHLIDTPATRLQLCQYYAEIANLDQALGATMRQLDEAGVADNTLLMFNSEQGMPLPFGGKWSCYESGLKTAFIVRWPAKVKPGSSTPALSQTVDILPTLVEIAGGDPATIDTGCTDANGSSGFDGKSLLAILKGESAKLREHVFGVQTTQGIINGSLYPIRSVRDSRYKLIRNLNHQSAFQNLFTAGGESHEEVFLPLLAAANISPAIKTRLDFFQYRPADELYDLTEDPHELRNLATLPEHEVTRLRLAAKLDEWMRQQADLGLETERSAILTEEMK
jgi:N-sulfoglucosamine sulfohydrolase